MPLTLLQIFQDLPSFPHKCHNFDGQNFSSRTLGVNGLILKYHLWPSAAQLMPPQNNGIIPESAQAELTIADSALMDNNYYPLRNRV